MDKAMLHDGILTVDEIKEKIGPVAKQYGVSKVYLFGSYARGEATVKSDVDLCVDEGKIRTLFQFLGFCADIEDALKKNVDVICETSLSEDTFFKENVEKDLEVIYGY
ncbi:MAG: nucleotidyltransferase domain-containing protein [Treponema sp.]|jgi:predicted nucleotidyltransferase|nr:nucleotidyltransferase domain-containing protein [Treponema sp.]